MSRFDLGRRFPLIIIPYRSFLHLMTVKEQLAALAAIRRHLEEDGLFAFNIFVPKISDLVDQDRHMAYRGPFPFRAPIIPWRFMTGRNLITFYNEPA